ncbi:hypothetical protein EON64_11565, partial [archaeon]
LTRQNLQEGESAGPVYAPRFPGTLSENWWVVLTDKLEDGKGLEPIIHAFEKITDHSRVVKHELRFMAPPHEGTYEMEVRVLSDCYLGLDQVVPVSYTVHPASQLPEYKPHPEDMELDNEPTLFEQMMAANVDESSDEDDDDDEDEVKGKGGDKDKTQSLREQLVSKGKKNVVVEDVDSEED